ncbi:MAG TPA: hypothetical protein VGM90_32545 [Kofleriaceae bacterium]|jgi:hypothetical protein
MKNLNLIFVAAVSTLGLVACVDNTLSEDPPPPEGTSPGTAGAGTDNTFDHENDGISPWELVDRLTKEGPPRYTSHVHSCSKVRYANLGNVLKSVGINTTNTMQLSAGQLYTSGFNAMGGPNYDNRIRESISVSTSGASRMFDIFAAGATEVMTAVPTLQRCMSGGTPAVLFDANGQCQKSGITCIIGTPATDAHVSLCNLSVTSASTPEIGKRLAVAAILAAAYTCE